VCNLADLQPDLPREVNQIIMKQILIAYDLIKDKDYAKLINKLKEMGATKELLSTWSLSTTQTPEQVLKELRPYHDSDDRLKAYEYISKASYPTWFSPDLLSQLLQGRAREKGATGLRSLAGLDAPLLPRRKG
jgi:hypothetical protein